MMSDTGGKPTGDSPSDDFIRGLVYAAKLARRAQHDDEKHGSIEQSVGAAQVAEQIEKAIKNKKKAQAEGRSEEPS